MKYLGRFDGNRRLAVILLAVILAVVITVAVIATKKHSADNFYQKRLGLLQTEIGQIPSLIEPSENTASSLDKYSGKMERISDICQELTSNKAPKSNKSSDKISKLCGDLTSVTIYSDSLYDSIRSYLLLPHESYPDSDSPEFAERLTQTSQTVSGTKLNLGKIDNSKVKDPAINELNTQLDDALALANEAQNKLKNQDYAAAATIAADLRKSTAQDRLDFMNARNYFWYNTVQIESLQKSIDKLLDQY